MIEIVIIIWLVLALISGIVFIWKINKEKRPVNFYTAIHLLGFLSLFAIAGSVIFYTCYPGKHIVWINRLAVLLLGLAHLALLYYHKWPRRNVLDDQKDSFFPEVFFTLTLGLLGAVCFTLIPRWIGLQDSFEHYSNWSLWDLPFVFMMPMLSFKLGDLASQIPFRILENRWVYPIEPVNIENWPWRNLIQVNFKVSKSLKAEYRLFNRLAVPWIEIPREAGLGDAFRLVMQERRKRTDLETIQDLGNEYRGSPLFWWQFSIKVIWYRPSTWRRYPRYLDPAKSIENNKIRHNDIVLARRIPTEGTLSPSEKYFPGKESPGLDYDAGKTVILK